MENKGETEKSRDDIIVAAHSQDFIAARRFHVFSAINADLRLVPGALDKPLRWRRPRKIFVNSMSDLFHEKIPDEYIAAVFGVMAACPQHTFQVLTKRAARMRAWFEWAAKRGEQGARLFPDDDLDWRIRQLAHVEARRLDVDLNAAARQNHGGPWPLPNVHLGVSAEKQETADERIPILLQCPAAVRWVSAEPLLGPIDGNRFIRPMKFVDGYRQASVGVAGVVPGHLGAPGIDWLVAGFESGPGARCGDIAWIRSLVRQCAAAGVPAFVKQLGAGTRLHTILGRGRHVRDSDRDVEIIVTHPKGGDISEFPEDLRVREFPRSAA